MEESAAVTVQGETRPVPAERRKGMPLANVLSFVVGLVGIAAIGASAWFYSETQREIVRLSTDIAQLRVSLELFGRQQGTPSGTDAANLTDLANRLAILEESWRSAPAPATSLPAVPAAAPATAQGGDCLPTGTRFLVGAGDSYPLCDVAGTVEIGAVDNGFISLSDGTVIAAGGNIGLPGSACMIGVVSAGEVTGYAEIRVTC
ncbi:hypothetical protein [Devosia ginsengisoli]|uniref:Uncharacterized protein n=1 Tax=Devosia ginsengisoli TaxID=400770 RepID=A0A5B8LW84_9HYPH|nr:hypothetical protein [Devosia ginsengisoli]QDZ11722.1 hypothetical protein FPZ08_13780 [Devosia ginsengisoli]